MIDEAGRSIFVQSPYIFPFYGGAGSDSAGCRRDDHHAGENNWRLFANYARLESARSEIDLRLFRGGMSHLKAMLIDDEYLIGLVEF